MTMSIDQPAGDNKIWTLEGALYVPDFFINLVSLRVLEQNNVHFNLKLRALIWTDSKDNERLVVKVALKYNLYVLEFNPINAYDSAFLAMTVLATPLTENFYPEVPPRAPSIYPQSQPAA